MKVSKIDAYEIEVSKIDAYEILLNKVATKV